MNKPFRVIRRNELLERIGLSNVQIWRMERAGKFPSRILLSTNSVGWLEHEVDGWLQDRIDARVGGANNG